MKVHWTEPAIEQLDAIYIYHAASSVKYAQYIIEKIIRRADQLVLFPYSGRRTPKADVEELRELIAENYRLYYLIKKERIDILAVFHTSQETPW